MATVAPITAYLLDKNGNKSSESVSINKVTPDVGDPYYIVDSIDKIPLYVGESKIVANKYAKTTAKQVVETDGANGRVFVTPAQKNTLNTLISNNLHELKVKKLTGQSIDGVYYHNAGLGVDVYLASKGYVDTEVEAVSSSLATFKDIFDGVTDADTVINKWHELEEFLTGITESDTLTGLITSAIANLKNGTNTWTGNNTFRNGQLKVSNTLTEGKIIVESNAQSMAFYHLIFKGSSGQTSETYNITFPNVMTSDKKASVAYTYNVPTITIGKTEPSNWKANDVWIDIS